MKLVVGRDCCLIKGIMLLLHSYELLKEKYYFNLFLEVKFMWMIKLRIVYTTLYIWYNIILTITVCISRQQNKWVGHKFMGKCCMFFVQTPMCSSFWDSRRHHVLPRVYGFPSMSVNKWVCHTICHNISFGWIWKRRGYQWICQFNGAHDNNI